MKLYYYIFTLMVAFCSLNASEGKPVLNTFVYENLTEDTSIEVVFMSESKKEEPSLLPFAHPLAVTEAFIQSAEKHGTNLSNFFKETDQSREIAEHVGQLGKAVKLRFVIPQDKISSLIDLLGCINLIPQEAGNISLSVHEKTKNELASSIVFFKKSKLGDWSAEEQATLFNLTPIDLLNSWMNNHFNQTENALIIALPSNGLVEEEMISEAIQKMNDQWKIVEHQTRPVNADLESIAPADKGIVVDGRIFMDSPSWWQKQSTGYFAGGALLFIGLLLAYSSFGISLLLLGISGGLLINHTYLSDPKVIEQLRSEVYQNGFYYAHKKQCLSATLTPFERRHFFVEEICSRQELDIRKISDFAGYYALNCYDYHSIEMRSFLYSYERDQLLAIQRTYLANIENVQEQVARIEAELQLVIAPFQVLRDASVETAYLEYNNCTAVVLYNSLVAEYNKSKEYIDEIWRISEINTERREEMLRELDAEYAIKFATFEPLISQAKAYLNQRLAEINAQYAYHVALCKNNISYDERMNRMEHIKWDMTAFYSKELSAYVIGVMQPVTNDFPDFLDLRRK